MITLKHPVVEEVLYQGLTDWVGLTTIAYLVTEEAEAWWHGQGEPDPEAVKAESLAVIDFLLSHDLMRAGELSNSTDDPGDFLDWPGDTPDILDRIRRDWDRLTSLEHFEPCWLRSTDAGREAGKAVDS